MATDIVLEIEMLSDWGVGTGAGQSGLVDRVIAKDHFGIPFIPAKTLTGVLRDAAERAAKAIGPGADAWVEYVFGSQPAVSGGSSQVPPRPAALSIRPAYVKDPLRTQIHEEGLAAATTTVRPAVKIDYETGTTQPKSFRLIEYARRDLPLEAKATWATDPPPQARAILALACKIVDAIGGKRRRGAGRCSIAVSSGLPPLKWDGLDWSTAPEPHSAGSSGHISQTGNTATQSVQLLGHLTFTTETPVTVATEVRDNTIITGQSIPGAMLLPLVARCGDIGPLLQKGHLVVTDATVAASGRRTVMLPKCFQREKRTTTEQLQNSLKQQDSLEQQDATDSAPKRLVSPSLMVVPSDNGKLDTASVKIVERAHAVINDEKQRPDESTGGLFVQQAIASGTTLISEVWGPQGFELEELPAQYAIGRSKKDDYGLVRVEWKALEAKAGEDSDGSGKTHASGPLTIWFQSDTLIRDELGAYSVRPQDFVAELASALSCELELEDFLFGTRTVNSWSATWNLPRPSLLAITAGSYLVVNVTGSVDQSKITQVQASGIGDRCGEGFGRIAINHPLLRKATVTVAAPASAQGESLTRDTSAAGDSAVPGHKEVLEAIQQEHRQRTSIQAAVSAGATTGLLKDVPLNTLREALPALRRGEQLSELFTSMPEGEELRDLINDPEKVWNLIGPSPSEENDPELARDARHAFLLTAIRQERARNRKKSGDGGDS